jgi:cytochrome c oxidase subunit 3
VKIQIIDIVAETPEKRRVRTGLSGGTGNGSSDGRGGGPDGPGDRDTYNVFVPDKSRILTWFLLSVVLMTFGGLAAAYIVTAGNRAIEWNPFELPFQIWISTTIILASSVTYHRGKQAIDRYDQPSAKKWLIATTVLGAAFISSQLIVWLELTRQGLYLSGNPYAGFFYILTAVHAAHVLGGIFALGSIVLRSWNTVRADQEWLRLRSYGQVVGWYWHFMGGVWVVLLVLLGFWK